MQSRPRFGFEGFQVWQDARDLAVLCFSASRDLERAGFSAEARLLRRAGVRPASQLGEASLSVSLPQFVRRLGFARDSVSVITQLVATQSPTESGDLVLAREMAEALASDLAHAVNRRGW